MKHRLLEFVLLICAVTCVISQSSDTPTFDEPISDEPAFADSTRGEPANSPCGEGEEIRDYPEECEANCSNIFDPSERPQCHNLLDPKCMCKRDYVRIGTVCKHWSKCLKCGRNEEPAKFLKEYQPTCQYLRRPTADNENLLSSTVSCFCKSGYVRQRDRTCRSWKKCATCGQNETPETFKKSCEPTCDYVWRPEKNDADCISDTVSCFCKEGYVRQRDGVCRPWEECTSCRENEAPKTFKKSCEPTCDYVWRPKKSSTDCISDTVSCFCKSGYVRQRDGVCRPWNECVGTCGQNEEKQAAYKKSCEPNCNQLQRPTSDNAACFSGTVSCFCKSGYVRNGGTCQPSKTCPSGKR